MKTPHEELKDLEPCLDGWNYAKGHDSLAVAWDACQRPEWLLWYARKAIRPSKEICSTLAIQLAEEVLSSFEHEFPGESRPRYALAVAKRSVELTSSLDCAGAARVCQDLANHLREKAYTSYHAAGNDLTGDKKSIYLAKHRAAAAGLAAAHAAYAAAGPCGYILELIRAAEAALAVNPKRADKQCTTIRKMIPNPFPR